jgi:hypothetical protein
MLRRSLPRRGTISAAANVGYFDHHTLSQQTPEARCGSSGTVEPYLSFIINSRANRLRWSYNFYIWNYLKVRRGVYSRKTAPLRPEPAGKGYRHNAG